jgi:hypothetical protein
VIKQISKVQIVIVSESGVNLWVIVRIWSLLALNRHVFVIRKIRKHNFLCHLFFTTLRTF